MKWDALDSFLADFKRIKVPEHRERFRHAVRDINAAFDAAGDPGIPVFPAHLRVKPVQGAPGIYELTWSFAGPDGRATFEFVQIEGELAIRWRRIGDHSIFDRP